MLVVPAHRAVSRNHRSRELTVCMYHAVLQQLFGKCQSRRCLVSIASHIPALTLCSMVKQDRRQITTELYQRMCRIAHDREITLV